MFKNYLKTAFRNLTKNKAHSFINIVGLSVGMAVAMLIGLWIWDELSFNKYHQNYDRIAQVMEQSTQNGGVNTEHSIPLPLGGEMRKSYGSNFKHIVMASWVKNHILSIGDKRVSFTGTFMEPEAPAMFSLAMIKGSGDVLHGPSGMLISQSVATALFANADPIGKLVKLDNNASFTVGGVYKDLPRNTTLSDLAFIAPWDYYLTSEEWIKEAKDDWGESAFQMFVQVADNADMASVSAKIRDIKLSHTGPEDRKKYKPAMLLQPMSKWHLYSEFKNGINTGGAIEYVWLFGIIGIFVLLLACINFMNLSTARSEKRAKEVGIRKAVGSLRGQLIVQFFCESLLMAASAFVFSLLLVSLMLPFFNQVAGKQIAIPWGGPLFWVMGIGFTIFTGLVAGSYPALYLSSFQPVKVLKGAFKAGRFAAIPRKVLVVVQFTVSVMLIIGTIVIFKQIQFAKNRPIGYNRAGLINVPAITWDIHNHFNAVRQDLLQSGAISEMAETSSPLTDLENTRGDLDWKEKNPAVAYNFGAVRVTSNYGKTAHWQLVAGRDFSQSPADSSALILNEAAVKYMGLKNPIGEIVQLDDKKTKVIGVVKDMVMESPYEPVRQTVFFLGSYHFDDIVLAINPNTSTHDAISKMEATFKKYSPAIPFSYQFADDAYGKKFSDEERVGKLASFFAVLAIFISCLGLFGMATFMAEQRIKEIGVRKVLGASVLNLWGLLSKEFVALVLISLLIAIPMAHYFMGNWLMHYQYHSAMPWWVFAATGAGAIIITLLTVSYQSIKAALMNPVNSLKTE